MAAVRRRAPAKIREIEIYGYKTSGDTVVTGDDTVDTPSVPSATETELLLY